MLATDAASQSAPFVRASSIAEHLSRRDGVLGVAVFGSVARGTASRSSDTDLLVLVDETAPSRRDLVSGLPGHLRNNRLGVQCYQRQDLTHLLAHGTSFTSHLRREARVLVDRAGELKLLLATEPREIVLVRDELRAELSQLDSYENLNVFRGNYLWVLSRLYRIAKAVVILGLYADGEPTFDRRSAFQEFRRRHPEIEGSINALERLQPFYLYLTRRVERPFPFPYRDCREEVVESIKAIRDVAAVVQ